MSDLIERLRAVAALAPNSFGGSSVVTPSALLTEAADLLASQAATVEDYNNALALNERLQLEAQIHAQEARTANGTIYEIYQVLSGGKGEPGNWHGADPAREYVANARAEIERLKAALREIATSEFVSDSWVESFARDALGETK